MRLRVARAASAKQSRKDRRGVGPHCPIINGIVWRLHTGAAWVDSPERYNNWKTIYDHSTWWVRDSTRARIVQALQLTLDQHGLLDHEQWSVDGSVVRAHHAAAGAEKGGRRR
mgnify:CR=1 FL=1